MSLKKGLEPFYRCLEKVKNINQKYFNTEFVFAPTHGDPQNILVSNANIRLIDWEYAGLNDPKQFLANGYGNLVDFQTLKSYKLLKFYKFILNLLIFC